MTVWPSASTRLIALLGWPARHSLSPQMHNAALREQGIDDVYVVMPTPPDQLRCVVEALGAVEAVGANVTVPHKEAVVGLCDHLTPEAELVGAVNTLAWTTDGLLGENTDATGLRRVLREEMGLDDEVPAIVLGTGGAARACAVALGRIGAPVTFAGRRPDAARDLAGLAGRCGAREVGDVDIADEEALRRAVSEAGLVVNATPLGMQGERLPEPFMALRSGQIAYDLVYNPPDTPFLVSARDAGVQTMHGLGMLVAQAAGAYRLWTGRDAPVATMSAVAIAALTGRH